MSQDKPTSADSFTSSVEDVAFCPSLPLAITASLSGAVGVWDIATQKLRHKLQHQVELPLFIYSSCILVCVCVCLFHVCTGRGSSCTML